jgi:hypothetical protein
MNDEIILEDHLWAGSEPHEVMLNSKPFILYRCSRCGREFAREPGQSNWKAVYVGALRVDFLDDELSRRWVSEPCPGRGPENENSTSS